MTDDRIEVDAALVARLLAAQFPAWADLPLRAVPTPGWDNRSFRLGDALKVRLPSAERYAAQPAKEHRWLAVLAPHLPQPIPTAMGLRAPGAGYPWPWAVRCWLAASPAKRATIAWTGLDGDARNGIRNAVRVDAATWERARGWALWKALHLMANAKAAPAGEALPEAVVAAVLAEAAQAAAGTRRQRK